MVRRLASVGCAVSTSSMCRSAEQRGHLLGRDAALLAARATASPIDSPIGAGSQLALALAQGLDPVGFLGQVDQIEVER